MPLYALWHRSSNADDDRLGNMKRRYFIDLTISLALVPFCPVMADWDIEQDESELPAYLSKENDGSINVDGSIKAGANPEAASVGSGTELVIRGQEEGEADYEFQSPGNIGTGSASILLPLGGTGMDMEPSAATRDREARRKINQYQAVVDDLEYEYGPYHTALREALADLALAYEEAGDFQSSHELYDRALHATRINAGLHSLEQGPILKELIDSLLDIGDVEEAVERQRYYYWIHNRAYREEREKMLPIVSDLIEWHWWAYGQQLGGKPFEHLLDAYTLARLSESIIESEFGGHSFELLRILHVMNIIDFQLYEMNIPVRESALRGYERGVASTAMASQGDVFSFGSSDSQTGLAPDSFMRRGKKRYERMLEAVITEYGEFSPEYYELQLRNIDWKLLFGKDRTAAREYTEVYQSMVSDENTVALASTMFSENWRLPIMGDPVPDPDEEKVEREGPAKTPPEDLEVPYIQVLFDVTTRGRVRNIRMEDTNIAAPDALFFRVRRDLIATIYRPRVQEGQVAISQDVMRYIEFPKGGIRLKRDVADTPELLPDPAEVSMGQAMVDDSGEGSVAEVSEE